MSNWSSERLSEQFSTKKILFHEENKLHFCKILYLYLYYSYIYIYIIVIFIHILHFLYFNIIRPIKQCTVHNQTFCPTLNYLPYSRHPTFVLTHSRIVHCEGEAYHCIVFDLTPPRIQKSMMPF